jgi:MOSC domain-containing protein YiiM
VLQPGLIQAGDELAVVHRPGHGVTVSTMFRALNLDRSLLPKLLVIDALVPEIRALAEQYVADRV